MRIVSDLQYITINKGYCMIYSVHPFKYVTFVIFIASILFFTPNTSMAEVSDPTRREGRETKAVNLEECIKTAIENNLQIAAARTGLGTAEADRIKASLLFPSNPKVISKIGERNGSDGQRTTDYMVRLTQEFQIFGQRRKRINVSNTWITHRRRPTAGRRPATCTKGRGRQCEMHKVQPRAGGKLPPRSISGWCTRSKAVCACRCFSLRPFSLPYSLCT